MPSLWPWPLRLVPPARKVTGIPLLAAVGEDLGDVAGVVRHHHRPREEPVGAGVGGVLDEVAGLGEHAVGAEQRLELAAQRLGDAGGDRVRGAVGRRLVDLRGERLRASLQQGHGRLRRGTFPA